MCRLYGAAPFSSPDEELNRYDMIFTRAGSASALHAVLCECANAGSPLRSRDYASPPTVSSGRRLDCLLLTAWERLQDESTADLRSLWAFGASGVDCDRGREGDSYDCANGQGRSVRGTSGDLGGRGCPRSTSGTFL